MGYYINPLDSSKEDWLNSHFSQKLVSKPEKPPSGFHWVCLVDNGPFTAAGIAYDRREQDAFFDGLSGRKAIWFLIPDGDLIAVCPEVRDALA